MTATTETPTVFTIPALGIRNGKWTVWDQPVTSNPCALCGAAVFSSAAVCVDCSIAEVLRRAEEAIAAYGLAGRAYAAREVRNYYGPQPRSVATVISRRHRGGPVLACSVYEDGTVLGWHAYANLRQWAAAEGVPAGARLKVLWTTSEADGRRVAAELDRLGLPRYRRVYRW
jgi:hypothetical protein